MHISQYKYLFMPRTWYVPQLSWTLACSLSYAVMHSHIAETLNFKISLGRHGMKRFPLVRSNKTIHNILYPIWSRKSSFTSQRWERNAILLWLLLECQAEQGKGNQAVEENKGETAKVLFADSNLEKKRRWKLFFFLSLAFSFLKLRQLCCQLIGTSAIETYFNGVPYQFLSAAPLATQIVGIAPRCLHCVKYFICQV